MDSSSRKDGETTGTATHHHYDDDGMLSHTTTENTTKVELATLVIPKTAHDGIKPGDGAEFILELDNTISDGINNQIVVDNVVTAAAFFAASLN